MISLSARRFFIVFTAVLSVVASACSKDKPVKDPADASAAMKAAQQELKDPKQGGGSTGAMEDAVAVADIGAVYFDYDRANVKKSEIAKVRKMADLMQKYGTIEVRLEGHADERGSTDYNVVLGQARAEAVRDLLTSYGVVASRLTVHSYGEEFPAVRGGDEAAYAKNRRVEFVIVKR